MVRLFMLISLSVVLCILVQERLDEQAPRYATRDWRAPPAHRFRPDTQEKPGVGYINRIPCQYDLACLSGECWEGFCNKKGHCRSMWTCA